MHLVRHLCANHCALELARPLVCLLHLEDSCHVDSLENFGDVESSKVANLRKHFRTSNCPPCRIPHTTKYAPLVDWEGPLASPLHLEDHLHVASLENLDAVESSQVANLRWLPMEGSLVRETNKHTDFFVFVLQGLDFLDMRNMLLGTFEHFDVSIFGNLVNL